MPYLTKEDQVAGYLREAIISGRYERGSRLKQAEIASILGLSITPVREAMKLLEAEGYVACESHRRVTVMPFDASASEEIRDLRVVLEERLVRAAVPAVTADDLVHLAGIQKEYEEAIAEENRIRVRGINYRFHLYLYEKASRPRTLHLVQILWARYPFDLVNRLGGRQGRAAQEHRTLLRHITNGDVESACAAIRSHIDSGWFELRTSLNPADQY